MMLRKVEKQDIGGKFRESQNKKMFSVSKRDRLESLRITQIYYLYSEALKQKHEKLNFFSSLKLVRS